MWFENALSTLDLARSVELIELILNYIENLAGFLRKTSFSIYAPNEVAQDWHLEDASDRVQGKLFAKGIS
jgi:hypothetical protein